MYKRQYLDNGELAKFYPTSVLATGGDILYPWVARMIMLGLKLTDKVPFKHVYLHGLVLDEHGVKMSKSKGNVINPIETLTEYGSDALRMGVMASRSAGQNQAFSSSKVVAGRNFCNKLWNIARYTEDKVGEGYRATPPNPESLADHWILKELATATGKLEELIDSYRFAEASELVYHTVWSSVADWYIEASKRQSNPAMLTYVLETVLKLAHPFAPFVTETIWQTLPGNDGTLLISAAWPDQLPYDDIAAAEFERLQALVTEVRLVTSELPGNHKYTLLFQQDTLVEDNSELICHLANLKEVKKVDQAKGIRLANSGRDAWIEIDEKTLYEHQSNLEVRLAEAHKLANSLEGRLNNKNYTDKAPENLVQETRDQLEQTNSRIERLQREFDVLT